MVVITNVGTASATRSSYDGKQMKRVWFLNIETLCQKGGLVPIYVYFFIAIPTRSCIIFNSI